LSHAKHPDGTLYFPTTGPTSLKVGGYKIVTTIDYKAQQAAENAAMGVNKGTPMYGIKKGIGAALVSVQPGTGNVIAYYGGPNGSGLDFGGIYTDPVYGNGQTTNVSVTPGSSFKTVTLAAALKQGISLNSYWYGPHERKFADRIQKVKNSGSTEACPGAAHVCTLWKALQESLNTVYYAVGEDKAQGMSPAKVIDMAADLGLKHIWASATCKGKRLDLTGDNGNKLFPSCLSGDVSFGGFPVTVQDMANVMATLSNNGVRADEHFVKSVSQGVGNTAKLVYDGQKQVHLTPVPGFTAEMANDEQWAMQQVYKNRDEADNQLDNHRQAAVKTGTWELGQAAKTSSENSSAFFNGYTAGTAAQGAIATSVWVGYTGKPIAIVDQHGNNIGGSTVPAAIWASYMNAYLNNGPGGKPYPNQQFAGLKNTGSTDAGETGAPTTAPPSQPQNQCPFPPFCGGGGGGGGGGTGGGGGGGPGGGGGTTPPPSQPPSSPPKTGPPGGGGGH
jgi:membrane peptidoglycan carboxypeptidase